MSIIFFVCIMQKNYKDIREEIDKRNFQQKIKETINSPQTQNIANYFVDDKDKRITDPEVIYKDLVDTFYLMFTDTFTAPYCKLLIEPLEYRTHVRFSTTALTEEASINNINYDMAYAMIQIKSENESNCVRILINHQNPKTCLVVCFKDCIWSSHKAFHLLEAKPVKSFPLVLDLITTPSSGYVIQEFLAYGCFVKSHLNGIVVSNYTH